MKERLLAMTLSERIQKTVITNGVLYVSHDDDGQTSHNVSLGKFIL